MELNKIHNCEGSWGKIILIEKDNFGNLYCGYCHKKVDYDKMLKRYKSEIKEILSIHNKNKKERWNFLLKKFKGHKEKVIKSYYS